MLDALTSRLRTARVRLVEKTIRTFGLQPELSARFGYGLTVSLDDQTYLFHLPDAATDPVQADMLRTAALPDEDLLLRLRRRTHPESVILDIGCGVGSRALFYAKSLKAKRVYALRTAPHMVALMRKNALLNNLEEVVRAYWLNVSEEKIKGPFASLDRFCKDQKLARVDLLSLNAASVKAVTGGGGEELLAKYGPALIFWGRDADRESREALIRTLAAQGYAEPESWTGEVLYWVSRI